MHKLSVPKEILAVTETLQRAGYEAYLVGGCVRDLIRGAEPKDWDVTTNARPDIIESLFPETFYENDYGTVGVVNETENPTLRIVEVTPYRVEGTYSDKRRPDAVTFSDSIEEDLKRRDFTVNAIAYDPSKGHIVDLYKGQEDIKDMRLTAVGDPEERFNEDALRMLRAIRLSAELGFTIAPKTQEAIIKHANLLSHVSKERIRDEFSRLILSKQPMNGVQIAHDAGLLKYIMPELEEGIDVTQNGDHIYTVWEHNLRALQHAADKGFPLHIRLAALLHDVSKPATRRFDTTKNNYTFYGHEVVGGRTAKDVLERLKYPREVVENVRKLVRYHLFFSDIEQITLSAVRRIVHNVGPELVWDLMDVRTCDRIGMGRPKERPYRLRKYESMIDEAMRAPVSVGKLNIDGLKIMEITDEPAGPRIGWILHALLEEVLDDPEKNALAQLSARAQDFSSLSDDDLRTLGEKGKEKKDEEEERELKEIRKRHGVI
ncbi:MAG: HD domain-containing protein [Candidatus Yonathbacteria bacterium]|nr:HD domain-containing protein [Candidatus Yonathbacteria bacterium]